VLQFAHVVVQGCALLRKLQELRACKEVPLLAIRAKKISGRHGGAGDSSIPNNGISVVQVDGFGCAEEEGWGGGDAREADNDVEKGGGGRVVVVVVSVLSLSRMRSEPRKRSTGR
jgi:hypothetical protein